MFYLKYLKSLIINNPIKIIYILLIIIPFSFFLKERNIFINNKYYVVNNIEFESDGCFYYIVDNKKNATVRFTIQEFDNKKDISKGYFFEKKRRYLYYIELTSIIIFSILLMMTHFFIIFGDESEFEWTTDRNGGHISSNIYKSMIKCELDDGIYYYTINKKLIYQSELQAKEYNSLALKVYDRINLYIENKNIFPDFESKKEKRRSSLNKILK